MQKKETPLTCKSVFRCDETDLKREYTKMWIAFINRMEQRKKTLPAKHTSQLPSS